MPDRSTVVEALRPALEPRDDPALWELVADAVLGQAEGLAAELEPRPRRLLVVFAALPRRHPETHPDDAATWRLAFALERGEDAWRAEGSAPHLRRRRGHWSLTVCMPAATRRLAVAEVVCLWRPRFPWAPPEETEIGREVRTYLRGADGSWQARGVRGA